MAHRRSTGTAREAVALGLRGRPRRRAGRRTSTASRPALVARPADTDQVAEVLRAAAAHGLTVVPRGRGTKLSWGMPPDVAPTCSSTSARSTRCSTTRPAT